MAKLLEGKPLAQEIKAALKEEAARIKKKASCGLVLAGVEVGEDKGADIYINMQKRLAGELGIDYSLHRLDKETGEEDLIGFIQKLNRDQEINGIILQQPLPAQLNERRIIQAIDINKDVEGLHPQNLGRLFFRPLAKIVPPTAAAVVELIKYSGLEVYGKHAVIVGRSEIVGKPLIFLLLDYSPTVTICHSATSKSAQLEGFLASADILIAAIGRPGFIKGEWVKEGALVIDVGINSVGDKIVGDVEFDQAAKRAAFISPVPGGVGPLTVVMLMRNFLEAVKLQKNLK